MKTLFIVRHAKSSWDFSELSDHDRPLNKRGKRNAPEMGQRLVKRNIKPDMIISSTARRAFSTAKRIAREINFPVNKIQKEPLLYHGSIRDCIGLIQSISDKYDAIMIFGHNPGFTDLSNYLSDSDIYNIPTCGIAEIEFDISSWKDVEKATGTLASFDFPKNVST